MSKIKIPAGETYTTVKEVINSLNGLVAIFYGCNSIGDKPGYWVEAQGIKFYSDYLPLKQANNLYDQYAFQTDNAAITTTPVSATDDATATTVAENTDARNGRVALIKWVGGVSGTLYQVVAERVAFVSELLPQDEAKNLFEYYVNNSQRQ